MKPKTRYGFAMAAKKLHKGDDGKNLTYLSPSRIVYISNCGIEMVRYNAPGSIPFEDYEIFCKRCFRVDAWEVFLEYAKSQLSEGFAAMQDENRQQMA